MEHEREEIRDRLFEKHDIRLTSMSQKMYDIAWEEGHASGEYDIENWIIKLKDLISPLH